MSRIKQGQTFGGRIADILNTHFAARNAQGKQLNGWYKSVWPYGVPFLVNKHDVRREEAVVWFPVLTDNSRSEGNGDWLNTINVDGSIITTTYVGDSPLQDVFGRIGRFIGKNHIVFARRVDQGNTFEFLGVYASERKGNKVIYRRFAEFIEPIAWNR